MLFIDGVYVEKRVNLASREKHYRVFIQIQKTGETRLLRKRFRNSWPGRMYGEQVLGRYDAFCRSIPVGDGEVANVPAGV